MGKSLDKKIKKATCKDVTGHHWIGVREHAFYDCYFTHSGAIGSKAFIEGMSHQFRDQFDWKRPRTPKWCLAWMRFGLVFLLVLFTAKTTMALICLTCYKRHHAENQALVE